MKLKSSNRKIYILLAVLALCALALFTFKTMLVKKATKYPAPPIGIEKKTELDLIQISLNEKSYLKLSKKRDKAIALGILEATDTDYVPATITFKGKDYRAEIRLKGDWTDHLKDDKWSFRIKLKDDKTILGMRKFSIHRPGSRGFINEWLYHKAIKEEGLIGLRYGFLEGKIHVKKNNSSEYITKEVGIYAIEESFDKRTIESNARKESVIIKFSEDNFWSKVKSNKAVGDPSGILWKEFRDYEVDFPITTFGEDKVLQDKTLHNYFTLSKNLLGDLRSGKKTIDQAFDAKELALQNAILNLFGATHGLYSINVRFYYNPITSKLEPIAFDGNAGHPLEKYEHFQFLDQKKDSIYLKELAYALEKVSKPSYLNNLVKKHTKELSHYKKELKKEYNWPLLKIENLELNQVFLRGELVRLKNKYKLKDISLDFENVIIENIDNIKLTNIKAWQKKNAKFTVANKKDKNVYKIDRINTKQPSYLLIDNLKVDKNATYQISMLIKKGEIGDAFGLRVQGKFPNRTDVVYNLDKATLKGVKNIGGFKSNSATIKKQNDGWYEISIKVKPNIDDIKLVFGSTNTENSIVKWPSPVKNKTNAYINISSIKIVELK